jgi:hypothetical protein
VSDVVDFLFSATSSHNDPICIILIENGTG